MFRVTPYVCKARILLQRRSPTEAPLACFSRSPSLLKYKKVHEQEREPCPPPPPPCPPRKDDSLLWGTIAVFVLAASFGVYAKKSPEIRDWLSIYAPWYDDIIAFVYQENLTYSEFGQKCVVDLKNYIMDYMNRPRECSIEGDVAGPMITVPEESEVMALQDEDDDDENVVGPCDTLPPPVAIKDICEIEACLKDSGDAVINNYMTARDACKLYNKAVTGAMSNFCYKTMKKLHCEMKERKELIQKSLENIAVAQSEFDDVNRYFECGINAPKERVDTTKALYKDYQTNIHIMRSEYLWENDKSITLDDQWLRVEALMDKYTGENMSMYSTLNYEQSKLQLQGADPDLLLIHSFKYMRQLEEQVKDASEAMTERVNRAVKSLPQGDKEVAAREGQLKAQFAKQKADYEAQKVARYTTLKANLDKELKDALKKQLERHEAELAIKLKKKEEDTMVKFNKMVAQKVAEQKKIFQLQLSEMAMKLSLVEMKLAERLKAERETKRSQALWAAGAALLAATKKGEPFVKVDTELRAIEKNSGVGDGDKLVITVLHSIPDSVWEKGVVPESVLREKYHTMEQVALQVALVEQDGAPLPLYFLSWLQSALLFMKLSTIPQAELDKPLQEPFKDLDTFDLLQRARFWIERGNIPAALRYVSSLEGASRAAAATWQDAARIHCETRQAAEALIAHAAALGLQYICE